MKRILFVFFALISLSFMFASCSNTPITVAEDKQKSETTIQLQERADKDSVVYKAVLMDNTLYLVNPKTKLVEMKVDNDSGAASVIPFLIFIMIILAILAWAGLNTSI